MTSAFDAWWAFCQHPDNDGQPLHNTPGDTGGWTAWGITLKTYQEWCRREYGYEVTLTDLENMSLTEAASIAKVDYWHAAKCDKVLGPLGIVMCDAAWLSGPGNAIMWLQRALSITADGIFGPMTLRACDVLTNSSVGDMCRKFTNERNTADSQMSTASEFNKGWTRRSNECLQVALSFKMT